MERIGKIQDGGTLTIDPARLVDTRVLIQGSSGSGKSWLIRLLVEKVAAKIPVLILDLEGEFVTLRESFDFVVAGEGGEVAVDVRSASLLARKLLELKLSGVVSLYDLTPPQKRSYVRSFLEAVMAAPRSLWAPRLIVLDEAHVFAPESSQSESLPAVVDVASRGRKRGYCLVAATQRLSKLHKDIAAECRNVFVGQTTLDVDVKRALDTLGFPVDIEHKRELRSLDHQFYAMGPATSAEGVVLFKADQVKTTHPESGLRRSLSPPEPSRRIKQALGELADLPKQAEEEAKTLSDAKKKISELQRQLNGNAPLVDEKAIERAVVTAVADRDRHWKTVVAKIESQQSNLVRRLQSVGPLATKIAELAHLNGEARLQAKAPPAPIIFKSQERRPAIQRAPRPEPVGDVSLGKAERSVLRAFYWLRGEDANKAKVGFYSGYSMKSSGLDKAISSLRTRGLVEGWRITPEGEAAADVSEDKPGGGRLREWLRPKIGVAANAVLDALAASYPNRLSKEQVAEASGYSDRSSGLDKALSFLRTIEAAEGGEREGGTKASDVFFE